MRHYLSLDRPPETPRTRNKPSKLDPYKPYILERLEKYTRLSRIRLFEEIQELSYEGKITILGDYLRQVRLTIPVLPEYQYETRPGEMAQCDWAECPAPPERFRKGGELSLDGSWILPGAPYRIYAIAGHSDIP